MKSTTCSCQILSDTHTSTASSAPPHCERAIPSAIVAKVRIGVVSLWRTGAIDTLTRTESPVVVAPTRVPCAQVRWHRVSIGAIGSTRTRAVDLPSCSR